jgi:hypothetical protein
MELLPHAQNRASLSNKHYATRAEAARETVAHIEGRRHSATGYIRPIEMELKANLTLSISFRGKNQAAAGSKLLRTLIDPSGSHSGRKGTPLLGGD